MIFQLHFRLFNKADAALVAGLSAAHWRKLLFGFCALGLRATGDEVDFSDETRNNVFSWISNFGQDPDDPEAEEGPQGERFEWNKTVLYDFAMDINTASFWFSHRKAADGSPLDIKIGDLVNGDPMRQLDSGNFVRLIDNDELVHSLYSICPEVPGGNSKLTALHTVITPEYLHKTTEKYCVDPLYSWDESREGLERNIGAYRYKSPYSPFPFIDKGSNYLYHIMLPLQDPERVGFNEERIRYYQDQMKQGVLPTVLALSRVFNKYRLSDGKMGQFDSRSEVVMANVIVDGHHKLEAARRMNWPVGLLLICDDARRSDLQWIDKPIPTWPLSEYVKNQFLPPCKQRCI
jgi:hypothetical protein